MPRPDLVPTIFASLPGGVAAELAREALALIELVELSAGARTELDLALARAGVVADPARASAAQIKAALKGKATSLPFAALLAAEPGDDHGTSDPGLWDRYRQFKALVLVAGLAVRFERDRGKEVDNTVREALAAARLLASPRERQALLRVLARGTGGFEQLRDACRTSEPARKGNLSPNHFDRIARLLVLFLKADEPRLWGGGTSHEVRFMGSLDFPAIANTDGNRLGIESVYAYRGPRPSIAEAEHDLDSYLLHGAGPPESDLARLATVRAGLAYFRYRQGLAAAWDNPLDAEIGAAIEHAWAYRDDLVEGDGHRCVLLSIAGGSTPGETTRRALAADRPRLVFAPGTEKTCFPPVGSRLERRLEPLARDLSGRALELVLPRALGRMARETDFTRLVGRDWREFLRTYPRPHGRALTEKRIAAALRQALGRRSNDRVPPAHITCTSPTEEVGLYYCSVPSRSIEALYEEALGDLFGERIDPGGPTDDPGDSVETRIGPNIAPASRPLGYLYSEAKKALDGWDNEGWDNRCAYHNLYCSLVILSLMYLTGHRPVGRPFETMRTIDLDLRVAFISDKEIRLTPAGRLVPLCEVAVAQIGEWLAYVDRLSLVMSGVVLAGRKDHTHEIHWTGEEDLGVAVREGRFPLFFRLKAAGRRAATEPIRVIPLEQFPADMTRDLEHIWPFPLRSARHKLRTELAARGLASDLLDLLMGHAMPGSESFAVHSALSLADMDILSRALDDYALEIGARVLKASW